MARPRKHGSASERQAAYRARNSVVSVPLGSLSSGVESIALSLDRPLAEVLHSMVRFALTNRDWKRLGLLPTREKP